MGISTGTGLGLPRFLLLQKQSRGPGFLGSKGAICVPGPEVTKGADGKALRGGRTQPSSLPRRRQTRKGGKQGLCLLVAETRQRGADRAGLTSPCSTSHSIHGCLHRQMSAQTGIHACTHTWAPLSDVVMSAVSEAEEQEAGGSYSSPLAVPTLRMSTLVFTTMSLHTAPAAHSHG